MSTIRTTSDLHRWIVRTSMCRNFPEAMSVSDRILDFTPRVSLWPLKTGQWIVVATYAAGLN